MSALCSLASVHPISDNELEPSASNPLVRKLQGLAPLTAADIRVLEQISAHPRLYGSHVDLIRDDEASGEAVLLLEGFACRYKQHQTGRRQIMAYLLPGDLSDVDTPHLGQMDHAVGTLSPCLVVRIPYQALVDLIAHHPNIAQALRLVKLAEKATLREWIVNLGCRSGLERMAHLFCELMTRFEAVGLVQDGSCPLPLTQGDLGDTLGLSNVHVNRTLQDMRRQGLVELGGKSLRLLKPKRVWEIGEFNPHYLQPAWSANVRF